MATETSIVDVARVRRWLRDGRAQGIREASGLTRSDIGRALGVSPSTISRWETGARAPRPVVAIRLLRLLGRLERGA